MQKSYLEANLKVAYVVFYCTKCHSGRTCIDDKPLLSQPFFHCVEWDSAELVLTEF